MSASGKPIANRPAEETVMSQTAQQEIVVGVTGSRASVAALRWAADEAGRRHARLSVVCAWDPSLRPAPYADVGEGRRELDTRAALSGGLAALSGGLAALSGGLAAAIRTAFGPVPPDSIGTELAEGVPERVLISRSATADLLVLGTAHAQDSAGLSVGPVIRTCLSRSRCPVVVVNAGAAPEADQRADDAQLSALTH
jgi:nucleotide-binding universal stress UspA family protein